MIRVCMDVELEQPRSNLKTPDSKVDRPMVIQVGYVIFEDSAGKILHERCREVNIGVPLSGFIKRLTGITDQQISAGTTIVDIIDTLHADIENYKASRKILTWGGEDQPAILTNLPSNYNWKLGRTSVNVKHLFQLHQEILGEPHVGGLQKSMKRLQLPFQGKGHNALIDAKNTARIFMEVCSRFEKGLH